MDGRGKVTRRTRGAREERGPKEAAGRETKVSQHVGVSIGAKQWKHKDRPEGKLGSAREARSCRVWGKDRCWMGRARRTGALVRPGARPVTGRSQRHSDAARPSGPP